MKKIISILAGTFAAAAALFAGELKDTNPELDGQLRDMLCPQPKEVKLYDGYYVLKSGEKVSITTPKDLDSASKTQIANIFKQYWRFAPELGFNTDASAANLGDEGFEIKIGGMISIAGRDATGVKQALKTLRQIAEAERDGDGFVFPNADIKDSASLKFRGIHFCIFPETTLEELEKNIRLASYYKFNYAVIEPWGVFPYKSHPEFAYEDKKLDRDKFAKLIKLCYELGITPIPQVSILGHGTQSRISSAKHAVLTNHPELENVFESYGWSYCMSSEKAEKILKDLLAEVYEAYGKPPFFHLGCDEAYDMGTCYKCRQTPVAKLLVNHLTKFNKYINELGARSIIWHDMLLDSSDPRWKNHVACGNAEIAKALSGLPKNIIIADWQYSYKDKKMTKFATPKHFKDAGYEVLVCPWEVNTGIVALAKTAKEDKLFGMLETTWHHMYGNNRYFSFFYASGDAAWNGGQPLRNSRSVNRAMPMLKHLRQVGSDMDANYETNGNSCLQIRKSID